MAKTFDWTERGEVLQQHRQALRLEEAIAVAAPMLERLLRELFLQGERLLTVDERADLARSLRTGRQGNKSPEHWTAGELADALFRPSILSALRPEYQGRTDHLSRPSIERLVELRNRAAHGRRMSARESEEFLDELTRLLRKFDRMSAEFAPDVRRRPFVENDLHGTTEWLSQVVRHLSSRPPNSIHIRLIGLTMYQAWDIVQERILDEVEDRTSRIQIDMAMLDSEWSALRDFDRAWPRRALHYENEIRDSVKNVDLPNFGATLRKYRFFPAVHGFVINDQFIIASLSRFERDRLSAAFAPYFGMARTGDPLVSYLFDYFNTWWDNFPTAEVLRSPPSE